MEAPAVFVVVLNWNGLEDTLECLDSLRASAYPNATTIVVDNGSRDDQASAIENAFPEAVVLRQKKNLGFCGGCNIAIDYALEHGADYVMLLNNDALVSPDSIGKLVDAFKTLPAAAALSPIILESPDVDKVWFSGAKWQTRSAQFSILSEGDRYDELSRRGNYRSEFACGCCMLIPVDMIRRFGKLDERYFAFYDEAAWCAKARREGFESYVAPSAVIFHKVSRSTPAVISTYLLTRNRLLWMKENLSLPERLMSVPYLTREYIWQLAHLRGWTKEYYSRSHSRAVLLGYKDYFRKRFYGWSDGIESELNYESESSEANSSDLGYQDRY